MRPRAKCLVGLLALVVAGGCRGDAPDDAADKPEPRSVVRTDDEPTSTTGDAGADDKADVADLPEPAELDLEERHPNGTVFRIKRVSFGPTAILVDVEVINGADREVHLNSGLGTRLFDDLEGEYNFVKPDQNPSVKIAPGSTLTGTLAFRGPVDRKATALTLAVNKTTADSGFDIREQSKYDSSPKFQFADIKVRRG
ncbi:MAG: hypothetical protein KY454_03270 [Actinobacteria bacterium]|nr:hypothetical protein [Actinomycetota bacterium]MBW3649120.1 hypothetical protein [Actinomycetota bacterium]